MPKDNIERAIKKAAGGDAENYDEIRYEGRGPGGVAIIVEAMTDNRNRTTADVRATFSKYGGAMGETGSVTFLFDHVGVIAYPPAKGSEDAMLELALDAGADECVSDAEGHEFLTSAGEFRFRARGAGSQAGRAPIRRHHLAAPEQRGGER